MIRMAGCGGWVRKLGYTIAVGWIWSAATYRLDSFALIGNMDWIGLIGQRDPGLGEVWVRGRGFNLLTRKRDKEKVKLMR